MGRCDSNIAQSREMLATAEAELTGAVQSMSAAAPGVRDFVIGNKSRQLTKPRA